MKKFEINYWDKHEIKTVIVLADDMIRAINKFCADLNHTQYCIKLIIQIG